MSKACGLSPQGYSPCTSRFEFLHPVLIPASAPSNVSWVIHLVTQSSRYWSSEREAQRMRV